ncbi:O-antigen ligase family protein [Oerskovia enterophila]|uniref:O-antigen ligase family protein n=1 Tax=Oerskovia enterophila TaxID=43678 RepID=UPI0012FBAD20|nr:O-antigen ligase family protein [Oerskovia enterophila]
MPPPDPRLSGPRRPAVVGAVLAAVRDGRAALLLMACVPLALLPGGLDRFTLPKLAVAACAVLAAVPVARRGTLPRTVAVLLGLGAAWLVVAALASDAPFAQVVGRWPRYEGLVALPVYVGVVWAGARVLGPGAPDRVIFAWARMLSVVSVVLGVVSVLEATGLRPTGGDVSRPGALLGNATDQGICGMVLLALLLPYVVSTLPSASPHGVPGRTVRPLPLAGALAAITVVVASGSRAALLGTVIVGAILTVAPRLRPRGSVRLPSQRSTTTVLAPLVASGLALSGALLLPASRARLTGEDPLAAATTEGRIDLWASIRHLVEDRPLVGTGPSGLVDAYPTYRSDLAVGASDPSLALDSPHAWPLQAAVSGGVPLLLAALALALTVLVVGGRAACRENVRTDVRPPGSQDARSLLLHGSLAAVVGTTFALSTHFTTIGTVTLVGLAAGALVSDPHGAQGTDAQSFTVRRKPWTTPLALATGGIFCAVLLLASAGEIPLARATAAAAAGDVDAAESAFGLAQALRPWDGDVALIAAQTFSAGSEAGHEPSARATVVWAERALESHPSSSEARVSLALGHLALADPVAAASVLDQVLEQGEDPRARLLRGVAAARTGDLDLARAHLDVAARNPSTADLARQNLAVLESVSGAGHQS